MAILNQLFSAEQLASLTADQRELIVERIDAIIAREARSPGTPLFKSITGEVNTTLSAIGNEELRVAS